MLHLVSVNLISAFPALRWVRVHFITLGILSQVIFGLLPLLVASLSKKPRPAMRWDIWLTLNVGFVALVAGFAGVNQPMIFTGGTLIFIAATLLLIQLWNVRGGDAPESLKFYITGIFYLLVGIIIGTGLWLNWSEALYIKVPLEAHIHANSWGFMSLVFAGLLVDFVPMITGRPLSSNKKCFAHLLGHDARRIRSRIGSVAGRQSASHRFRFDSAFEFNDLVGGLDDPSLQSQRKIEQRRRMAFGFLLHLDYRADPGRAIYFAWIP